MKQAHLLLNHSLFLCAGLLSLGAIGCGKEEIKVYTAPKDVAVSTSLAAAGTGASPQADRATPSRPRVTWKTPEGWTELAPTSMRVGNFSVISGDKKADIAILPFPGTVGGELENVNRWRGEIGLPAVEEGGFQSESVQIGSEDGKLYDLQGTKQSTVAAMIEREGTSWFFKMRGDKELVAATKPGFVAFLKTISFPAVEPIETAEVAEIPSKGAAEEEGHADGPKWDIPKHWKLGADKPMVLKNWDIAGDGGRTANVAINSFPGDVGGVVANVNRWRGQMSLPALSPEEVKAAVTILKTKDGHSEASLVDFKGKDRTGKPSRLLAAILPHGGDTWFYKLTGDEALVEREKAAFLNLVQTASYH